MKRTSLLNNLNTKNTIFWLFIFFLNTCNKKPQKRITLSKWLYFLSVEMIVVCNCPSDSKSKSTSPPPIPWSELAAGFLLWMKNNWRSPLNSIVNHFHSKNGRKKKERRTLKSSPTIFKEFTFILKFEENLFDSYHIKLIEVFWFYHEVPYMNFLFTT